MNRIVRAAIVTVLTSPLLAQGLFEAMPVDRNPLPALGILVRAIAGGDADQDGDDDLAVAQGSEAVLFRQYAGGFVRTVIDSNVGFVPATCAIADIDGDGFSDLLFGPYTVGVTTTLRIWWGDAAGQFPTANPTGVSIPLEFGDGSVAPCDVDHDGDLDLVLGRTSNGLLHSSILERNLGNRTFAEAPSGQYPRLDAGNCRAFCVDIDGDTFDDVVVASRTGRTRLYWNNSGNFAEASTAQFPVLTTSCRGIAVGDLDGDGDRDLALGGDAGNGRLLVCTGPRQFGLGAELPTDRTVWLLADDRDGDGDLDLVAFRREQGLVLRNDGAAAFAVAESFGSADETRMVAPLDLDDDGDEDLLRVGVGIQPAIWPQARVTASFRIRPGVLQHVGDGRLPASMASTSSPSGDVNGDGLADLTFLVNEPQGTSAAVTLQFGINDGRGVFAYRHAPRIGHMSAFYSDLDFDGYDECVLTGTSTGYFANHQGELATTVTPLPFPSDSRAGAVIDADQDGAPELLMAMRVNTFTQLQLFENVAGTWQAQTSTRVIAPVLAGQYPKILAADFDGDQQTDVWLLTENGQAFLRNIGGVLTHVANAIPPSMIGGRRGAFGDLDGDGDLDIHTGPYVGLNRGDGTFVDVSIRVPAASGNSSLGELGDLDDDGDLDLLGNGLVAWNDGTAHFTPGTNLLPMSVNNGGALTWTDADRDGDLDLLGVVGQAPALFYTNMLRQLWLQEPARLGGSIEFHYEARPGSTPQPILVWFASSFASVTLTQFLDFGWVQVDPSQLIVVGAFALPAQGGEVVHHEMVPNTTALRGVFFCAQPVELRGNRWRIGNFVSTWIGR